MLQKPWLMPGRRSYILLRMDTTNGQRTPPLPVGAGFQPSVSSTFIFAETREGPGMAGAKSPLPALTFSRQETGGLKTRAYATHKNPDTLGKSPLLHTVYRTGTRWRVSAVATFQETRSVALR